MAFATFAFSQISQLFKALKNRLILEPKFKTFLLIFLTVNFINLLKNFTCKFIKFTKNSAVKFIKFKNRKLKFDAAKASNLKSFPNLAWLTNLSKFAKAKFKNDDVKFDVKFWKVTPKTSQI